MAGVITEIAIECGVSEQAVRAWCRRNHVAKDAKGSFAISESQKTAIYQHYLGVERKQVSQQAKASCETCETTLIAMLQGELDRKSEQLAVKDKQIEELNARLAEVSSALVTAQQTAAAAQALHAGTMHQQLLSGKSGADQPERETEPVQKRSWWRFYGSYDFGYDRCREHPAQQPQLLSGECRPEPDGAEHCFLQRGSEAGLSYGL